MERWGLANIEFVGVPADLSGYAHGLLMHVTGYMKTEKPIRPDENVGGKFVSANQVLVQTATARRSPNHSPSHENMLRFVDYGDPAEAGFPSRLFASYLIATAEATRSDEKKIEILRLAVRVLPGDPENPSKDPEAHGPANPNAYFGWENLGTILCETGRTPEGLQCLEEAVARWPVGASGFKRHVQKLLSKGVRLSKRVR